MLAHGVGIVFPAATQLDVPVLPVTEVPHDVRPAVQAGVYGDDIAGSGIRAVGVDNDREQQSLAVQHANQPLHRIGIGKEAVTDEEHGGQAIFAQDVHQKLSVVSPSHRVMLEFEVRFHGRGDALGGGKIFLTVGNGQ